MGGASADLVRSIATRAAQARRCYNSQLVKTPTARGSMRITMRLDPDGQVCTAHVTASELPREMDDCVLSLLEAAAYVAPTGGCLDVNLPLQFQPMVAEAGTP